MSLNASILLALKIVLAINQIRMSNIGWYVICPQVSWESEDIFMHRANIGKIIVFKRIGSKLIKKNWEIVCEHYLK